MIIPRRLGLVEEGRHYMLASVIPSGLSAFYADSCLVGPVKLSDENGLRKEFPYPGESFVMRLILIIAIIELSGKLIIMESA